MNRSKTQILVEGALAVALSVAFSYLKLWRMPQGGSITLENLPLLLFALRHGFRFGLGAGMLSGLLQLLLGGYVVHPLQALLDYPFAFGCMGLAALMPKPLWLSMTLASAGRFICHLLSGVIFFASYAPEGTPVWLYSAIYNGSFMLPSLILSILLGYLIWPRLQKSRSPEEKA
ncbi:MAG TPA: energy-coupled thiamine transporter ThiT [Synergistaceae bacterium]|nr:energy-coupled thiamine transporter ThiT [Synergistaceae bacterium]HPJ26200.1 energy-coupled thiamine transporter ThiT [Synergistaceae bacterium]HPQ36546.1 energy-coupled thiamine transporter ThiT [Synergistaceae bacterium]